MSELISGKEAFDAAYNGDEAQWRWTGKDVEWRELKGTTSFSIDELKGGVCEFRLKPRTITINGIEVPAPFKPKGSDKYWFMDVNNRRGYDHDQWGLDPINDENWSFYGAWRTEEEIKQVVAALRSIFKPQ